MSLSYEFALINKLCENNLLPELTFILKYYYFRIYYSLVVDARQGNILKNCIDYAYIEHQLDHVLFNGLPYYERSSNWQISGNDRPDYDPDVECYGHDTCDIEQDDENYIYPQSCDSVELVIKKCPANKLYPTKSTFVFSNCELFEEIQSIESDKVLLVGYSTLKLYSASCFNYNHPGSDHCKIILPYSRLLMENEYVTLFQFIQMCFELKSHKWHHNGDYYFGNTVSVDSFKNINITVYFKHRG